MKADDVLRLVQAGYTKEEIAALEEPAAPAEEEPEQEETEPAEQPAPAETEQENPEILRLRSELQSTQNQLKDLVKQMQQNNLKTASVNILPEKDLDAKTDAAMAELIRPTFKKKGD